MIHLNPDNGSSSYMEQENTDSTDHSDCSSHDDKDL
jgi:hypothetical protein